MGVFGSYKRWRHSKGFGVHSPYAFRFISDVINPGEYGYYQYSALEALLVKNNLYSPQNFKNMALLMRTIYFLKTKRIIALPSISGNAKILADSSKTSYLSLKDNHSVKFREGDLLMISGSLENEKIIEEAIISNIPVLSIQPDINVRKILEKQWLTGVLFNWKNKLLYIPRQDMAYVSYTL